MTEFPYIGSGAKLLPADGQFRITSRKGLYNVDEFLRRGLEVANLQTEAG